MIICDHCREPKADNLEITQCQVSMTAGQVIGQVGKPMDLCKQCRDLLSNELSTALIDFRNPAMPARK